MTAAAWHGESGTYTMMTPWLTGQLELGAAALLKDDMQRFFWLLK